MKTEHIPSDGESIVQFSFYDPETEFQEIGVRCGGKTFWKIYSNLTCEAVIDDDGDIVELLHDPLGNLTGIISEHKIDWIDKSPSPYGWVDDRLEGRYDNARNFAKGMMWHSLSTDPTGYIWMGARYYDPKDGRFLSTDPVGFPLCSDLYSYANCDPINYHDPDGRFASEVYKKIEDKVFNKPWYEWRDPSSVVFGSMGCLGLVSSNLFPKEPSFVKVGDVSWSKNYFTYSNGINTNRERGIEGAETLSSYIGGHQIELIHCPTNGSVFDLFKWGGHYKLNIESNYVKFLQSRWDCGFSQIDNDGLVVHYCHSAGVMYTKLALMNYPQHLRDRIIVVPICPSAHIGKELCGDASHFCSNGDLVHKICFEGFYPGRENVTFLEPHKDASWFDHDITSPTFINEITDFSKEYID